MAKEHRDKESERFRLHSYIQGGTNVFTYLPEKKRFTIRLGQYISHSIVKPNSRLGSIGDLQPPTTLNALNRYELAQSAYDDMPSNLLVGEYSKEQLLHELAVYIDKRIPQSYVKWKEREHDKGPAGMKVKAEDYGFVYHFDKDGNALPESSVQTLIKKVKDEHEKTLIQFTEDMKTSKRNSVANVDTEKRTDASLKTTQPTTAKLADSNYDRLNAYLQENDLSLDKDLYKAILFAMNGMSNYYQTKTAAIKKASNQHGVTQKAIKEHIDAMGIISERASQNGYTPKEVSGKEATLQYAFNRRLEREEKK